MLFVSVMQDESSKVLVDCWLSYIEGDQTVPSSTGHAPASTRVAESVT